MKRADPNRYGRDYSHGEVVFHLPNYPPNPEECRYLVLKVMEQAVRDYTLLFGSDLSSEKLLWITAASFIFDDDYRLVWGDWEISTEDLLEMVDIDISWFRKKVASKFNTKLGEQSNGTQEDSRE